jgi:Protein of unknown function (DUF3500)
MPEPQPTAEIMADLASQIVAILDEDQRARACFPFPADEERRRFYWVPTDHGGLALRACGDEARALIMQLVAAGLSPAGFNTAAVIVSLQHLLSRVEGWQATDDGRQRRDPLEYQLSIFGEPGSGRSWAWRLGGHHLSLSYAVLDGTRVAPTPSFFGADPADSPLTGGALLRPLGRLEDLGRELVRSLDLAQVASAVLSPEAPHDLIAGNQELADGLWVVPAAGLFRAVDQSSISSLVERYRQADEALGEHLDALRFTFAPKGIPASALSSDQRQIFDALIASYLDRLPDDVADSEQAKVISSPENDLHFAWAGSFEPDRPHYYRVQGSRVLLEYENLNGNHIHSVWRDPFGDFGDDPLTQHRAAAHR